MLTETWMKPHYRKRFQRYNCFREDKPEGYGGLITLIKTKYESYSIPRSQYIFADERIEAQPSKIMIDGYKYFSINFYIHPLRNIYLEELHRFLHLNELTNKKLLFWAVDFNAKHPM